MNNDKLLAGLRELISSMKDRYLMSGPLAVPWFIGRIESLIATAEQSAAGEAQAAGGEVNNGTR